MKVGSDYFEFARDFFNSLTNLGDGGNLQIESVPWTMRNNPAPIKSNWVAWRRIEAQTSNIRH